MTGPFVLFIATLWLLIVVGLVIFIGKKLTRGWKRAVVTVLLFVAIAPFPLVDELVAQHQFHNLCAKNSGFQLDRSKAIGRTIYLARMPDEDVKGTWVRVVKQPTRFIDATTAESVISYDRFVATGGQFSQFLGVEGRVPLLFRGVCDPGYQHNIDHVLKELNITVVRKP
jgi:hypothetical protein